MISVTSRRGIAALAVVALTGTALAANGAPAPEPGTAELTLLQPAEGYVLAGAQGINDDGDVVGLTRPTDKAQPQQGIVWNADEYTPELLPQLEGSQFARPFDISTDGTVAGEVFDAAGVSLPAAWNDGSITQLPSVQEEGYGVALDISNDGTIISNGHDGTRTVGYTIVGSEIVPLTEPSSDEGEISGYRAHSISGQGNYIAGVTTVAVPHGDHSHDERLLTVWADGEPTVYETEPHDARIDITGVNNAGTVSGYTTENNVTAAAIWADGAHTALTNPNLEGYPHTAARSVNDEGTVVGFASKFAGNVSFGAVALTWFDGAPVDLNTLVDLPEGVTLTSATDINEAGQIVGTAMTPEGQVGFVLTPPAPEVTPSPTPSETPSESASPSPSETPSESPSADPSDTPSEQPSDTTSPRPGEGKPGLPDTGK